MNYPWHFIWMLIGLVSLCATTVALSLLSMAAERRLHQIDGLGRQHLSRYRRLYGLVKVLLLIGGTLYTSYHISSTPEWLLLGLYLAAMPLGFFCISSWCEFTLGMGLAEAKNRSGWIWQLALACSVIGFAGLVILGVAWTTQGGR